jgi:hypothetical protein
MLSLRDEIHLRAEALINSAPMGSKLQAEYVLLLLHGTPVPVVPLLNHYLVLLVDLLSGGVNFVLQILKGGCQFGVCECHAANGGPRIPGAPIRVVEG